MCKGSRLPYGHFSTTLSAGVSCYHNFHELCMFNIVHKDADIGIANVCKYIVFGNEKKNCILEKIFKLYLQNFT
jgi:hypothetical protein